MTNQHLADVRALREKHLESLGPPGAFSRRFWWGRAIADLAAGQELLEAKVERLQAELDDLQGATDVTVIEPLKAEIERLRALAVVLLENRGRLKQIAEDYQPGLPERRLADDLLDAIETVEAAEVEGENQ